MVALVGTQIYFFLILAAIHRVKEWIERGNKANENLILSQFIDLYSTGSGGFSEDPVL